MLKRLFPKQIDNVFRGHWLAIWFLAPLVLLKMLMGANTYWNTRYVIEGPDSIPLQSYSVGAQEELIFTYQAWGLGLLVMAALGLLALIRYRAMVPLMYLELTLENVGRTVRHMDDILLMVTGARALSTAAVINLAFIAVLLIGLALSLMDSSKAGRV